MWHFLLLCQNDPSIMESGKKIHLLRQFPKLQFCRKEGSEQLYLKTLVNCQAMEHRWKKKGVQECVHSSSNESVLVSTVHTCRASCLHSQIHGLAKMVWVWQSFALHCTHLAVLNRAHIKTLTALSNRKMTEIHPVILLGYI